MICLMGMCKNFFNIKIQGCHQGPIRLLTACVRKVIGSIPARDSDFYIVPCSCHVDQFTIEGLYVW